MPPRDKGKEPKVRKKPGRTPTSCAECRRLKLRCDKNVPCEKCVSRGCGEICPNGVLTSTKGNRMILSGTEELHERISQLQGRVRDLESALRTMQAAVSDDAHPLLDNNTLRLPPLPPSSQTGSSPASTSSSNQSAVTSQITKRDPAPSVVLKVEEDGVTIDAFGTLTIEQNGAATYIGKTARSEFLIWAPLKRSPTFPTTSERQPRLGESPSMSSTLLDFEDRDDPHVREQVYKMLPPLSEALRLCEIYLEHGKLLYTPITRQELLDEIFTTIYQQSTKSFQSHHALALLFAVFSLASHFDPKREPHSPKSREYYELARTSLGFASPVRQTTLAAIQTLIHMAQYLDLTDTESQSAWMYIGQAVRFAFSIGLHLNAARWTLPRHEIDRRSRVFWQLFTLDTWTSFYLGRPPSISPSFIDSEYPREGDATDQEMSFHSWSYRFASLLSSAMASGMGPKQPPYTTILHLDRQIRDFHVPVAWRAHTDSEPSSVTPEIHLSRWLTLADKETVLLNLHRPYFAQALHDSPHETHKHRYLPSVVAIYRASWRIVHGLQLAWATIPQLLTRLHLPWSQALSAAIVLCVMITKLPSGHLTGPSGEKLKILYSLFDNASSSSKSAAMLLPSVQSLCQKAQEAIDPSRHHPASSYEYSEGHITQTELDRLSGKTHLFAETGSASPSHSDPSSSSSRGKYSGTRSRSTSVTLSDMPMDYPSLPSSTSGGSMSQNQSDLLHPVLVQDLQDFAARTPIPSITSLSDAPSDSESSTPTGGEPMAVTPALPPREQPRHPQHRSRQDDPHNYDGSGPSYRPVYDRSHTPLHLPPRPPSYFSHPEASSSSSTQFTPSHPHVPLSHHPTSNSYTSRTYLPHPSASPTSSAPSSHQRPPPLPPGFTTDFQHYYETVELRKASDLGRVGSGTGFVSGYEPAGSLVLDGTWQGFLEQLGF